MKKTQCIFCLVLLQTILLIGCSKEEKHSKLDRDATSFTGQRAESRSREKKHLPNETPYEVNLSGFKNRLKKGEKLQNLWEEAARSELSVSAKIELLASLIEAASSDHSTELEALIITSFPIGNVRDTLISVLYANSNDPFDKTLDRILHLNEKSDKGSAVAGLVGMLKQGKLPIIACEELAQVDAKVLNVFATQALWGKLISSCKEGQLTEDQIDKAFADFEILASYSSDKDVMYGDFLKRLAILDPDKTFQLTSGMEGKISEDVKIATMQDSLVKLASQDPVRATNFALSEKLDLTGILTEWLRQDSDMMKSWFNENKDKLDGSQTSQYYRSLVNHSVSLGDWKEASTYLDSIEDDKLKQESIEFIQSVARNNLQQEVDLDASGTLQKIVNGQSEYSEEWLEQAMGTWVEKDFDKANEWYKQNWKTLSPSKSQYIAAAFATQASNQGDAVTARQWVALIQDTKTKQRIEANITKKENPAEP